MLKGTQQGSDCHRANHGAEAAAVQTSHDHLRPPSPQQPSRPPGTEKGAHTPLSPLSLASGESLPGALLVALALEAS